MERIVVGVDPSPAGRQALEWAVREALARGASLHAVRAWQVPTLGFAYAVEVELGDGPPSAAVHAQQVADDELKLARDRVPGGDLLQATASAVSGAAPQVLVDSGQDAALVVVGSRGLTALSRAVLGSVSSSVVHHARCPVAVVPEAAAAEGAEPPRVLVGVDHSASSLTALHYAVEQARRSGAVLVPVLAHEPLVGTGPDVDLRTLEGTERTALLGAAHAAGASDLVVEPEVCTGHAGAVLTALVRPQDVLVTGSRGRGGFRGLLLGSTSTAVAQHATCVVVVVRG